MVCILIGRSASGKTSIADILKKSFGYTPIVSCTTRPRREGEPANAYDFITRDEFDRHLANGDFIETDEYGGNMYGMLKSAVTKADNMLTILTPQGAAAFKNVFPDAFVVHVYADMATCVIRAVKRAKDLTPDSLRSITERACHDYELFHAPKADLIVDNNGATPLKRIAANICLAHKYASALRASMR